MGAASAQDRAYCFLHAVPPSSCGWYAPDFSIHTTGVMADGSECSPEKHVWWREDADLNTPIGDDRMCVCGTYRFGGFPDGTVYRAEYHRADGGVFYAAEGVKR